MTAVAKEDFKYHVYLFDEDEADEHKVMAFKKGDLLPFELVQRLEKYGPDWVKFDGDSDKNKIISWKDLKEKLEKDKDKVVNKIVREVEKKFDDGFDLKKEKKGLFKGKNK